MNSVQESNNKTPWYGQPQSFGVGGGANSALPRQSLETGMNLPTSAVPPAFASPRSTTPTVAEQQALLAQLNNAGYRIDDSRLNEIARLVDEQRTEKENLMYMGAGLMGLGFGGDFAYDFGALSTHRAGQHIKDKWLKPEWLNKFDDAGKQTSLRLAGLEETADGTLKLIDPNQRKGLKGFWDRNAPGVRAVNHKDYMEAAKQLKLQEVKKLNQFNPNFTDEMVRNSADSAVTGTGKLWKQAKNAVSPVTDAVGGLAKDILQGVQGAGGTAVAPAVVPPIDMTTPTVVKHNLQTAKFVEEVPPVTTPKVGFFKEMKTALDEGKNWKFAKGVGGKALGVAGIGLTAYSVGSNAIDNYKNENYRAIATDVVSEGVGLAVSSIASGVIASGLVAASVAFPPLLIAAPFIAGIAGGFVGQGATNLTKWAIDPFFKWCGLTNKDDNTRSQIKENRELLTNIAAGTGSSVGAAFRNAIPRQAMPSNPSMFSQPVRSGVIQGLGNF
jgi:hypothetical protein